MVNNICFSVIFTIRRNALTGALLAVALGLAYVLRQPLRMFPAMVDWNTVFTLSELLLITTGIKESCSGQAETDGFYQAALRHGSFSYANGVLYPSAECTRLGL